MKKQARDIAKTSNGKVVLVAADELKVFCRKREN